MEIRHAQADRALEEITIVKETATPSSQEDDVEDPVAKAEFDAVLGQVSARLDARAERALRARKEGRTTPFLSKAMASVRPEDSEVDPEFWDCFNALPAEVQKLAKEKHELWLQDTTLAGLDFKKLKGQKLDLWEVYVGRGHRAICVHENGRYTWLWIGTKQEALKII